MTPLRQRMIEDMQLRGLSARTQEVYVAAVRQLAEHYRRSPAEIAEEEPRQDFLYLANEKKVARATATIALCGIRFLYEQTLARPWTTLRFVRPPREKKLPVVLSRDETRVILAEVRIPVYRACLTTPARRQNVHSVTPEIRTCSRRGRPRSSYARSNQSPPRVTDLRQARLPPANSLLGAPRRRRPPGKPDSVQPRLLSRGPPFSFWASIRTRDKKP
jgi:hypothetical protein